MTRRWLVAIGIVALVVGACSPGANKTAAPTSGAVTGSAVLGAWESSPSERSALASAIAAFNVKQSNVTVTQETVAGDYRAQMITRFGAHNPPDLFYINAEYARDWADEGFLLPLDDFIARDGFDTSKFFPDYLNIFKGTDGKIYGLPKDGNTIAMAVNTDVAATAPTTLDELVATANSLKGTGALKAPLCMNAGLDRGLTFIYAQGGSLLNADGTAEAISTDASKNAVQWYLNLFKDGLAMTAADMGDGWCGEALGKGDVAMAFEGGWLYGYMNDSFPEINWTFAEVPTGSSGSKVTISYTAAYGIGADSANKEQAWEVIKNLTGREGMAVWTGGGIAVPSRSDVPVPAGFEVIVQGASYSKSGSGFIKGYNDIQKAFQDAFTLEIQNGTYSADAVVQATAAAVTAQLAK
ncbi:MAG: extracellular solute-binding protein [Candidatus Limnocylindrales bacterium]